MSEPIYLSATVRLGPPPSLLRLLFVSPRRKESLLFCPNVCGSVNSWGRKTHLFLAPSIRQIGRRRGRRGQILGAEIRFSSLFLLFSGLKDLNLSSGEVVEPTQRHLRQKGARGGEEAGIHYFKSPDGRTDDGQVDRRRKREKSVTF